MAKNKNLYGEAGNSSFVSFVPFTCRSPPFQFFPNSSSFPVDTIVVQISALSIFCRFYHFISIVGQRKKISIACYEEYRNIRENNYIEDLRNICHFKKSLAKFAKPKAKLIKDFTLWMEQCSRNIFCMERWNLWTDIRNYHCSIITLRGQAGSCLHDPSCTLPVALLQNENINLDCFVNALLQLRIEYDC